MGVVDLANKISSYVRSPDILVGGAAAAGFAVATSKSKRPFQGNIAGQNLVFPLDLERFSISMCFSFKEYQRRSIFTQPYLKAGPTIRLPVAKSIADKFKMNWQEDNDDPLVGAVIEGLLDTFNQSSQKGGTLNTVLDALGTAVTGGGAGAAALFGQVGIGASPLSITFDKVLQPFGVVTNPFLTVLFKNPEFKRHVFSWKFIPRSPEEARQINAIIQSFKYHMLPDIIPNVGGTMLAYPDIVNISFYNLDNYLYRFKSCVLEGMDVNYAPGAQGPSFFKGSQNVPTEIDMTLSFLEIEYWSKQDFNGQQTVGGGFQTSGNIPNMNPA